MAEMDLFYRIIKYPLITEKSVLIVERQNKITVIVDKSATKKMLKEILRKLLI